MPCNICMLYLSGNCKRVAAADIVIAALAPEVSSLI